ncbi:MAG: hypothetical protein Q9188_001402 [Gyalolechia gomerana]
MSSTHVSGLNRNDKEADLELKQLYHNTIKQCGDSSAQVASDDQDQEDMARMGKKTDLKRIFRQSSMIAFTCIVQATWQVFLLANTQGLTNGGHAGRRLVEDNIIGKAAEYIPSTFVRSLAPGSRSSLHLRWMSTLSWQATAAGATFVDGTFIQGIIAAYTPHYTIQGWKGTLFVIAVTLIVGIMNVVFARALPQIQKFMAILFGLGWIPVVVVLIALAPHPDASVVFTSFTSDQGWTPIGLSVMVGQISSLYSLVSFDAAAHMSEEVRKAGLAVPRAMMWSYTANAIVGIVVVFAYLYSIVNIQDALSSPTGFPFLYVCQDATYYGTLPIAILLVIIATAGCTGCNASASRETFAFARDDGLPFKSWISKVQPGSLIPRNSVILTCAITILLALINIGSTVAFNAIISLQLIALMATYCTSIGCVFYRRITDEHCLPPAQWSLGSAGKYINAFAFVYSLYLMFWIGWPPARDVTPVTFNWAAVLFAAVFIVSLVFYYANGRKFYRGPVTSVQGRDSWNMRIVHG